MKRITLLMAVVLAMTGFASSTNAGLRHTALHRYHWCQHKFALQHGRPCGRNIVLNGWKLKGRQPRPASRKQVAVWSRRLHSLTHPPAYLSTHGVPPRQPPGGAQSTAYAPTGRAACIVAHESGGNPRAVNGQYRGIAQWSPEAWARHGGRQYASEPTSATKQQQLTVLSNGLTHYGCRDWCPYDGC